MPGFISPYRSVRYQLKERGRHTPKSQRVLFNLRHSSLRTKIEFTFGSLKNRFKILSTKPHHPFFSQVDIVVAYYILHNYIIVTDPIHNRLKEEVLLVEEQGDIMNDDDDSFCYSSPTMQEPHK